ncbi:hypothetical protein [Amycolatopsis keratiniphila]|uniref:hypothetical protein n=1 Tax=Amycolatopsis keratiniphila TaxID=129921 RepID=UPI000F4EDAF2|nr:hypothetical protein [Amycolatopsis keratiniphila]
MNAQVGPVLFDANTLINFAVVGRLDLLGDHYGHRAKWTETVRLELHRGRHAEPKIEDILNASWLGKPVEVSGSPSALLQIDLIRRALGGTDAKPFQHLGEAEIIYYIETVNPGTLFVTDDRPALDFAKRRQIFAIDSATVLGECHSYGEIGCPDAYDLLIEMREKDRGVLVPADHSAVC